MSGQPSREQPPPATLPSQSELDGSGGRRVPCLTLLYHTDLGRIGQRAVLDSVMQGEDVRISRCELAFCHPGETQGATLDDPYVSASKSVRLTMRWPHGLEISADPGLRATLDSTPLDCARTVALAELRRGAVLVLARRVVILVHLVVAGHPAPDSLGLVGHSDAIEGVRRAVCRVADLDVPVLIRGESGVGKERIARAIHDRSGRAGRAYLAINMAAINRETAVSELFGHGRGAFTGAVSRHAGVFEQADGGTLFLDEIGDTPESIQPVLLRVLESGDIQPLHESSRRVDVRILAATDADLEAARERGAFRSALLYRLAGFEIHVPPLRERRDDIARLVVHLLGRELERTGESHRLRAPATPARPWFPPRLMVRLVVHPWKNGNVRQLANVVRQLVIANRGADVLELDQHVRRLLDARRGDAEPVHEGSVSADEAPAKGTNKRVAAAEITEDELVAAYTANQYAIRPTAAALGLPVSSLYSMIEKSATLRTLKEIPTDELVRCAAEAGGDLDALSRRLRVSARALKRRLKDLGLI
ncbi:MAG: hypothetical protein Tsb0020_01600 [Haliangiales bacterium]